MWRAIMISFFFPWMPEVTPKQICKYHDVAEHLNLSANQNLLLYTTPKRNWEEPLEVKLDFTLISILSVKEKLQVVTFYFWLNVIWTNEFVSWNPSDFCNISTVSLPVKLFWIPDIYIDERADEDKFTRSPFLTLTSNGSMITFQVYRLTSSCNLDVHAFPFDEQKCNLSLMASMQLDNEILMKSIKTSKKTNQDSRNYYLTNGEWKFQKVKIIQHTQIFDGGNVSVVTYENFIKLQLRFEGFLFLHLNCLHGCETHTSQHAGKEGRAPQFCHHEKISMKRRSIFHVLVLILPTFTLFLLDMVISFSFVAPGEIIAFKLTLILEISVLSLILNDMLPATSDDPPIIGTFFSGIFMFMVIGILENALIAYLRENKSKVPFFKGRTFVSRFLKKENKDSEHPMANLGEEMPKRNVGAAELSLAEKDNADNLVILKHLNVELQEIKKHLTLLEGHQVVPEAVTQQDKTLILLEKVLSYSRLLLSIIFLVYIVIKWTH